MDYDNSPSLLKYTDLNEYEIRSIMQQLVSILAYIHTQNICHRDIKPENILYDEVNNKIKLIDFGISKKIIDRGVKRDMLTITGTLYYRAPEMFLGGGYDEKVDMWAAGITLYQLINEGKTPF
jgi:calcium-dependent protein kinase